MLVLVMTLCLGAPWCHSLKEKRAVLRPLVTALRRQYGASVAESGLQDTHQRMEITLALLVHNTAQGDRIRQQVLSTVSRLTQADLYEDLAEYR
ncbi:MAG: DUF503 domain-containing protein [Eubacteriales bacterium]|nr:DUF503 domain-containing protein [Eubacteriales bacterium]MDD4134631.1 DUF503 domain-containing protein [Eubacteriales bacterium]